MDSISGALHKGQPGFIRSKEPHPSPFIQRHRMLSGTVSLGLVAFSFLATADASDRTYTLDISNGWIAPDGFNRVATLAGGDFPGPILSGEKGDCFSINVINNLTDNSMATTTSIHWHGIFQRGTNFADGAASVTQCPITSGHSFLYTFDVPDQAATQYCDGLRGALIIYDPDDPHAALYDVDDVLPLEPRIVARQLTPPTRYHDPSPSLVGIGKIPVSNATLINGKGRYLAGPDSPLSIVNVQNGTRYRFRLIAMSCDSSFTFSIDMHIFTVIEADGGNTMPLKVDSLVIHPGQRYSVVVNANQPVANYWIRADANRGSTGFDDGRNLAILRYAGAQATDPVTTSNSVSFLSEVDLHPLSNASAPGDPWNGGADVNFNLVTNVNRTAFRYTMNGVSFVPPSTPVLLQILSGAQAAQDLMPTGSVYSLPLNKVIEISLPGTSKTLGGPHTFHLHGHSFSVVRSGDDSSYNYANPVIRDTINTGLEDGNATIRFITDNAGPCHIDWHLEAGLAVVLAEDIPSTRDFPVSMEWKNLCS
ncbi:hypothetical protein H0H92_010792 [Tricholoma furcatifolium]|nr:hypothetical protein H0H92_010792 [Tricholoma furcatifolium]